MLPSSNNAVVLEDPLRQNFLDILKSNGVLHPVATLTMTEPPELIGEHMASASVYVRVQFQNSSIPDKNLFVKKFTSSPSHTELVKKMRIMEKEAAFFNDFLPKTRKFCQKYNGCGKLLDFFPKCYYGDEDMVVMENLVLDDTFIMLDKEARQDLFTAKFVLANLARFHAASYAFIEVECGGGAKFRKNWDLVCSEVFVADNNPMGESMLVNGVTSCIYILKSHPVEGGDEAIQTLTEFSSKTYSVCRDAMTVHPEEKVSVLNHGDCWNNNMLFKMNPATGLVNDHVFVDLQVTRFGSPNLDISYFLYTSVQPEIRRQHLKELLQHYFNSFKQTLEMFGMSCPITFEDFVKDYRVKSQLGFCMNLLSTSAVGALKDMDMEKMSLDPKQITEMFSDAIGNWVSRNPVKAAAISTEIVAVLKEQEKIQKGFLLSSKSGG